MSNYTKTTDFLAKDSLPSGNSNKVVKGAEIDTEFTAIASAIATKANTASPTFTGTITAQAASFTGNVTLGDAATDTVTVTADVASNLIPSADSTYALGDSSNYWSNAYIDAVTTTGNVSVGGNLTVTGNATISGTLTFGDADTDSITLNAEIASNVIPDVDGTYNLGSAVKEWQDLYIDGTANIDSLVADTAAISAGTIDNTVIGGTTAVAGTFTTATATTGAITTVNSTTVNATTVDSTNVEVTNIKAKDGTASATIADATGVMTIASSVLTTADINGGSIDGTTVGATTASTGNFSTLSIGGTAITATAAELNALDGITATVTELNYTDGVTSAIQTQLDAKAPIDAATFTGTTTIPTADINGGTIDGVTIGGSTAAAGTFTTFTSTGIDDNASSTAITIDSSQNSTFAGDVSIASGSNVGIGIAASATKQLHILGDNTNTDAEILLQSDDTANAKAILRMYARNASNTNTETIISNEAGAITLTTASTERMRISSTGSVAIGTTSADGTLHVHSGSAGAVTANVNADDLVVENSATGGISILVPDASQGGIYFGSPTDTVGAYVTNTYSTGAFAAGSGKVGATFTLAADNGVTNLTLSGASGSEQAVFAGKVGIGTSSPATELEVEGTGSVGFTIHSADNASGNDAVLNLQRGTNQTWGADLYSDWRIRNTGGELLFEYAYSGSTTESMRIDSSGNVGIGTSSPLVALEVVDSPTADYVFRASNAGTSTQYVARFGFSSQSPDNNTSRFLVCADTTTTRLNIYSDGDVANHDGTYGTISDRFYKTDIVEARSYWEDWKQIGFKTFTKGDRKQFGVIADELEQVFPSLVHTSPDDNHPDGESQWVDTMNLNHIAGKVLQEAMAKIEALEAEVAALKGA